MLERSLDDLGPGDRTEHVCSDHASGAYDAVRYLWELGHRRIGLLARTRSPTGIEVVAGYRRAVLDRGADARVAVLAFDDPEAVALQETCLRAGLRLPSDLATVSYDDEQAAEAPLPLTAVAPAKHRPSGSSPPRCCCVV